MGFVAGIRNKSPSTYGTNPAAGGGIVGPQPFIFDPLSTQTNIQSNRVEDNSAVNPAAVGIFSAGNDTSGTNPGATANYTTIGGGDQNQAGGGVADPTVGAYATVGGGYQNTASGLYATIPGGSQNLACGPYSACLGGLGNQALGSSSIAGGLQSVAGVAVIGFGGFAVGNMAYAPGTWATAFGAGSPSGGQGSIGPHSFTSGFLNTASGDSDHAMGRNHVVNSGGGTFGGATAVGDTNIVQGGAGFASGYQNEELAEGGTATGAGAVVPAIRPTQRSYASGVIAVPGDAQKIELQLSGQNTGVAAPLYYNAQGTGGAINYVQLESGKAYLITAKCIAQSPTDFASFSLEFPCSWAGGANPIVFAQAGTPAAVVATPTTSGPSTIPYVNGWQIAVVDGGNGQLQVQASQASGAQNLNLSCSFTAVEVTHQ